MQGQDKSPALEQLESLIPRLLKTAKKNKSTKLTGKPYLNFQMDEGKKATKKNKKEGQRMFSARLLAEALEMSNSWVPSFLREPSEENPHAGSIAITFEPAMKLAKATQGYFSLTKMMPGIQQDLEICDYFLLEEGGKLSPKAADRLAQLGYVKADPKKPDKPEEVEQMSEAA